MHINHRTLEAVRKLDGDLLKTDVPAPAEGCDTCRISLEDVNVVRAMSYLTSASCEFSGCGDSGSIDAPELEFTSDTDPAIKDLVTAVVETLVEEALSKQGVDWYNNEGGQGSVEFNLAEHTLSLETTQNVESSESDSTEVELEDDAREQASKLVERAGSGQGLRLLMEWSEDSFEAVVVGADSRRIIDVEEDDARDIYGQLESELSFGDYANLSAVVDLETMKAKAEANWYATEEGEVYCDEYSYAEGDLEYV